MRSYVLPFTALTAFTAAFAASVACGSSADRSFGDHDDATDGGVDTDARTPSSGDGDGSEEPNFGGDANTVVEGCSDEAKLVYVVSTDRTLYSFAPNLLKFTAIGKIDCSKAAAWTKSYGVHSMAVDREGTAWVNIGDSGQGGLFKVSTKDASCEASGFETSGTWASVGMGFVANPSGDDTLYLYSEGSLASFDRKTLTPTLVGGPSADSDFYGARGELTGTGIGELYGAFVVSDGLALGKFDRDTGDAVKVTDVHDTTPDYGTPYSYAFSYWGGDFWFYQATGNRASKVIRYKAATDESQSVVVDDVGGFQISGAGVSTCAPTKPVVN